MTPDLSGEDLALIRRYWPALPDELINPERARMARERATEADDALIRSERALQGRNAIWVKGQAPGPLTLRDIEESTRMGTPQPPESRQGDDILVTLFIGALVIIACCCGATVVGALWAVIG